MDDFISIKAASERLNVKRDWVWRRIKRLKIPEYRGADARCRYIRNQDFLTLEAEVKGYQLITAEKEQGQ